MRIRNLLAVVPVLILAACAALGPQILGGADTAEARMVGRITARHNTYVSQDNTLDQGDQLEYLEQAALAAGLADAGVPAAELAGPLLPVLDRHDLYVSIDPGLDFLDREQYLASSDSLRTLLRAAGVDF